MAISTAFARAAAMSLGACRFGSSSRATRAVAPPVLRAFTGPDTLEELFAARYARGDIDRAEYQARVDDLARQLHC